MTLRYIRLATEEGLGTGILDEIEIVGDADVAKERWGFHVGDNIASLAGDVCWFGPLRPIQKLFFHTPLVYVFVFGSYLYHDFLHWPIKGQSIYNQWLKESKWGKLFQTY
jgi:hypothetical protein